MLVFVCRARRSQEPQRLEGGRGYSEEARGTRPCWVLGQSLSQWADQCYGKEELGDTRPIREVSVAVEKGKEAEVLREGLRPGVSQTQG